jgi:Aspartyl protease
VVVRLCIVLALVGCHSPRPAEFAGGVQVPLAQSRHGSVFVPVVINGRPLRFIFDTGASISAVTPEVAEALQLVPDGTTKVNGTISARLTRIATLSVGSIEHRGVRVAIVALPEEKRIDERFDGVLGLDILSQHDVAIDFPRQQFVFYPPNHLAHSDEVDDMIRVDFTKSRNGLVELSVAFDERGPIPAFLDLGAQRTITNAVTANWIEGPANGNPERAPRGLNVGKVRWEQFSIIVEDLPIFDHWIRADELAVILGADLFRERQVVLAYQDGALFVSR